tara:strand:+ start:439 stop:1743 length:1305 start_codon:yes stop_codon:yes gene_type:complete
MANETTTQIVREDPRVEAYRLGTLKDVKDLVTARLTDESALPPAYQVAGLTGLEKQAATMGQAGLGAYAPYLQGGLNQVTAGQNMIQNAALPTLGQGQEYLLESGRLAQQLREIPYQYQTAAGEGMLASAGTFDPSAQRMGPMDPQVQQQMEQLAVQGQGLTPGSPEEMQLRQQYQALEQSQMQNPVDRFMNPFQEQVVQQTMDDIASQGAVQQQQARANAVSSGAFGGARSGIMESELAKNMLREQGRAAGNLRTQGFESARNAAQQAFENTQNRRLQASEGIGNLGLNYGQLSQADIGQMQSIGQGLGSLAGQYAGLGTQAANLGLQQAGLGQLAQSSNLSDIQTLTALGAMQRGQQQAELDAVRQSNVERLAAPYQQLGFLSDISRGTPTSQATITTQGGGQQPSTAQQVLGLGIAGLGAVQGARTMGMGF